MKNNKLILVYVIFFICIISSVNADYTQEITTIKCYDTAIVKAVPQKFNSDYTIKYCKNYKQYFWKCQCRNNITPIIMSVSNTTTDVFNVVLEYYISLDLNDDNKRTLFFNNININYVEKEKEFEWPEIENTKIIFIIMLFVILFVILLMKWLFNLFTEKDKKEKNILTKEETEKINKILRNI